MSNWTYSGGEISPERYADELTTALEGTLGDALEKTAQGVARGEYWAMEAWSNAEHRAVRRVAEAHGFARVPETWACSALDYLPAER